MHKSKCLTVLLALLVSGALLATPLLVAAQSAPMANDDAYHTNEDTALIVGAPGVLGNDTDADGDTLTAALMTGPMHGTLALSANGSFTYTPNADYFGPDSFTYRATDPSGATDTAVVTIHVAPVNDLPVAADDAYSTDEDTPLIVGAPGVLGNDTDADGDTLTAALASGPMNGTLALNADGSFTYTPNANYFGPDSFTYEANDGAADSNVATVDITVNEVNDPPDCTEVVVDPDSLWPPNHKMVEVQLSGATDPDDDEVSIMITDITSNQPDDARGSGNTSPDWEFDGDDTAMLRAERSGKSGERVYTIEYTADDGRGGTCEGSVEVRVPHSKGKSK